MEATPRFVRRVVIVFVDDSGQSTIAALRRARSLRPTTVRAVPFVLDSQRAERLRAAWPPDPRMPLQFVDCPGRSLAQGAVDLVRHEEELPGAEVTVILPRHSIAPPSSGRTGIGVPGGMAGRIAQELGQVPDIAVMIIAAPRAAPSRRAVVICSLYRHVAGRAPGEAFQGQSPALTPGQRRRRAQPC